MSGSDDDGPALGAARAVLDAAHEGFISMDANGLIIDWNTAASEMFGYSSSEAVGQRLAETIIPPRLRAAHEQGLARFLQTGEGPILNQRIEVVALGRGGRELDVELTIAPVRHAQTWTFHAFLHDITQRRRHERYLSTQYAVTAALAVSESVEATMPELLQMMCEGLGWEYGEYWKFDAASGTLRAEAHWHGDNDDGSQAFAGESRRRVFTHGEGLPGRVLESDSQVVWIEDVRADHTFVRLDAAIAAGFAAAIALRVAYDDRTTGVLSFFSRKLQQPDDALIEMMQTVVSQISQYMARKQSEQRVRELQALELNDDVLQGLVAAKLSLEMGRSEEAVRILARTIDAARRIMNRLVTDSQLAMGPGDFVREE